LNSPKHALDYPSDAYLDGLASDSDDAEDYDEDDPYCDACERQFTDMMGLNQHLAYSSQHNWCFDCSRDFGSETALQQHQNSLAHSGRNFKCPFCQGMFKSPSGIALHIESGCHKLSRHHVTAAVHKMKIVPNISIKRITGPIQPLTLRTFIATEASFNGSSYNCYLCRNKFKTLSGLNSHLNSPAHDDDEFRCPKCKTEFKLISGFIQHLETRSCGLAETTQIGNYFDDLTASFGRLLKM
jgi:Zn finger protein HypA/HybF involved in hydrogenase expression